MSNVDLMIGGRSFKVACAPGEEEHVTGLGRLIDEKIAGMGDMGGQSEARLLLFASLLLADELHEIRHRSPGAAAGAPVDDTKLAENLESVAAALEKCAINLEGGG